MQSLSPPGRICCRQLAPCGASAPPNPPSASHDASPGPPPRSARDLTAPSARSELGGPSICLRLLETSSGRCLHAKQRSLELLLGVLVLEPPRFANEAARRDLAGRGVEEAQGLAQGCHRQQRQRTSCRPSPSPRREQQAELAGLPVSPDEGRMSSPQEHPDGVLTRSKQSVEHVGEMRGTGGQQVPGTDRQELAVRTRESDGTEEDAETPEELLLSLPSELSVLERLGLHRVALTEQDVEAAFAHLALAFRCDVFTLRQRMQVEKRARDAAEENIQEELGQCRAALERLGPSCTDTGCKETLEQLQCSLAVLAAAVERATTAAEKLGAVHQEARMSRAAEVMVQHVENLKRHHMREHAELEEMKRLIQQNSRNRQLAETQDDTEPRLRPHPLMRTFQQGSARRRVSIAVIPKQLLVPALTAERPWPASWRGRGPSAGPAPRGPRGPRRSCGGHGSSSRSTTGFSSGCFS
ncbi:uncharacterized protein LOC141969665 isoform X4 [Athene noctua]|uniref:uncharacterized protein LOC141969665 isoform X4 n=1 Tax=Athene noctua TaxID=126797 RepID=UPI003EB7462C